MEAENPTALIVDDNYFNRDLCALALEHVGYNVFHAENGREAINRLQDQKFNLLILDLAMPELDGMGVIREMHEKRIQHAMFIIVMTANPHMATNELDADVDFVVYKPIDINEFSRLAERLTKSYVNISNTRPL
ncbi:MAG: response regulator [Anaerolineae bacterium]|nr:response regulator [Anaerolineae bacterium]